ncbi:MAG: hypothetical protein ABH857_00340 [Elusimicrobiota bacterium]
MLYINNKIIYKIFSGILFVILISQTIFASDGYRRHFLSYGPSASASALGESYTALGHDGTVSYYNPALLTTLSGYQTSVSNWFLYDTARYSFAGFSSSNEKQAFSISGIQFLRDNIEVRTNIYDEPTNTKNSQLAIFGAYARYIEKYKLHTGLSLKYLNYEMYTYTSTGFSLDLGFAKDIYFRKNEIGKEFRIASGLRIQNIIQKPIKMIEEEEKMPFGVILGLGLSTTLFNRYSEAKDRIVSDRITFVIDLGMVDSVFEYSGGLEYSYKGFAHLRGGWKEGLTGGVGFTFGDLNINYALLVKEFTSFNKVDVAYRFGPKGAESIKPKNVEIKQNRDLGLMKEAQRILSESQAEEADREKKFNILFKEAKGYHNAKKYLKATDKFREIMLYYPEQTKVQSYYDEIKKTMKAQAENEMTTDFEKLAYSKAYMNYINQNIGNAVNEWNKVLQFNENQKEVKEYKEWGEKYLADTAQLEREKELEAKVKAEYGSGTAQYDEKKWISSIKTMEGVQSMCKKNPFPRALEWNDKAQEYINKALEKLAKSRVVRNEQKDVVKEAQPKIDKEGADKKYREGLVSYAHGKTSSAIQLWEIAVRLDPGHDKAWKAIDRAKEELGAAK